MFKNGYVSSDRELREAIRLNKDKTLELMTVRTPFMFPPQQPSFTREKTNNFWGRSWRRNQDESSRHEESKNEEIPKLVNDNNFIGRRFCRPFRHPAICDNCKDQIIGERHKCNECLDYDLCQTCIDKSNTVHPGHTFTFLSRSYPRWHHRHPERDSNKNQEEKVEEKQEPIIERQPSIEVETAEPAVIQPEITQIEEIEELKNEENERTVEKDEPAASPVQNHPLQGSVIMEAMHALASMGFQDKQKNVRLYLACGGDLQEVMNKLLDE